MKKLIGIIVMALVLCACSSNNTTSDSSNVYSIPNETTVISTIQENPVTTEAFEINGKEGQVAILNSGTADQEANYCYFLDSGSYTLTNNSNEKVEFAIADDMKIINDSTGLEEWANLTYYTIEANSTITITIEDNNMLVLSYETILVAKKV